jgi:amino acid transporter
MIQGGPVILTWTWLIGTVMSILISLSLAEISSTYPSAGSVYHWAGSLASPEWGPFASYFTGWFNVLGNGAGDAFFAFSFSSSVSNLAFLVNPEEYPEGLSVGVQVAIGLGVSSLWALQNLFRVDRLGWMNNFAAFFQIASTLAIILILLITCPEKGASTPQDMFFTFCII